MKGNFSWGFSEKKTKAKKSGPPGKKGKAKEEEQKEPTKPKQIKTLLTLKDIDFKVRKGEFVCIIGDVGAGKTSLLKSIVGDLIYIADDEIASWGGQDVTLQGEQLDAWKNRILAPEYFEDVADKPIKIGGKLAYVEQNPWI